MARLAQLPTQVASNLDPLIDMGRSSYGYPVVHAEKSFRGKVAIGAFSSIGRDVVFQLGNAHPTDWITTYPFPVISGEQASEQYLPEPSPISVGSDVWIGDQARIMTGVTVGHGAVIGAFAVVASDVRPYAIVVGNPAKELRRRFTDAQVEALLRIAWWDWTDEKISDERSSLCSPRIDDFIERFDPVSRRAAI